MSRAVERGSESESSTEADEVAAEAYGEDVSAIEAAVAAVDPDDAV